MFKVGDRVVAKWKKYNPNDPDIRRGEVIAEPSKDALSGKDKVYVKWNSTWYKPNPEEVLTDSLLPELEAQKQLDLLDQEYSAFESQVEDNMEKAAELILESNDLAKKAGLKSLQHMHEAISSLYDAMDQSGWNTSSFNC